MTSDLSQFDEIVVADTEFIPLPGEKPDPIAVCARELRSGRVFTLFDGEMGDRPPYRIDDKAWFVAFAAAAELEVHLALGWPLPANILDLRVEHINHVNRATKRKDQVARKQQPRSLIEVLRHYGIPDGDVAVKAQMIQRILQGRPFTAGEPFRYYATALVTRSPWNPY